MNLKQSLAQIRPCDQWRASSPEVVALAAQQLKAAASTPWGTAPRVWSPGPHGPIPTASAAFLREGHN